MIHYKNDDVILVGENLWAQPQARKNGVVRDVWLNFLHSSVIFGADFDVAHLSTDLELVLRAIRDLSSILVNLLKIKERIKNNILVLAIWWIEQVGSNYEYLGITDKLTIKPQCISYCGRQLFQNFINNKIN